MEFLNLNQTHIIDRIIPKEMLYENADLTEKEKQFFVNSVDRVKLYYALKTDNSNIEADIIEDCTYDEIVFIELKLRNLDNFDKILKIIHSSIPKPLVIVSNYEDDKIISVATKTNSNNKIKLIEVFNTPKIDNTTLENISFEKVRAKTLSEVYKNYISLVKERIALEIIDNKDNLNSDILYEKSQEKLLLQQQLEKLKKQLNAEKQNSKKPELMKQIKEIKDTLERI